MCSKYNEKLPQWTSKEITLKLYLIWRGNFTLLWREVVLMRTMYLAPCSNRLRNTSNYSNARSNSSHTKIRRMWFHLWDVFHGTYHIKTLKHRLCGNSGKEQRALCKYSLSFWRDSPQWARASSFTKFLDHTKRRITYGRTPLDEWSSRRRDLYLTTYNTHNRQTSMPPVGLEPTFSAG